MFKLKTMANEGGAVIEGGSGGASTAVETPVETTNPDPSEAKFTQADLDKAINDRLARQAKKYADYDDLKAAKIKLDELEAASATDLEKAVKAAQETTRSEVSREFGEKTVRATFIAHLKAAKVDAKDAEALVDDLNVAKYVSDDGSIDDDAITATLARITPTSGNEHIDLGQGGGGASKTIDQQIAEAREKGDVATAMRLNNQKLAALAVQQ